MLNKPNSSSNNESMKNSEISIQMDAPQVVLNDTDKSMPKKNELAVPQIKGKELKVPKINSKSFLDVPKQSSLNTLQVSQVPIGSATGNPRNKVALRPGYSLMDWIRLTKTPGKNLSGVGGRYRNVTISELNDHSSRNDAWMAINGLVFNVTGRLIIKLKGSRTVLQIINLDTCKLLE